MSLSQDVVYADKSQIPTVTIVAIVAPIAASVVLFFFG
jgi:hypothetical protein